jgi:adenosylcobinamide-GDP ribazoletransferase
MRTAAWLFEDFAIVAAFLTRLPVGAPTPAPGRLAEASWAFPVVGAGVGGIAGLAYLAAQWLGCGDLPAALLALLAGVALTGGLHEDGLADTADGFGGGADREQKLAIMRDSRLGTFGGLALIFSVALRAGALAAIGTPLFAFLALIAAHAVSRGLLPAAMHALAPARKDGLGAEAGRPAAAVATVAAAICGLVALATLGPGRGALAWVVAAASVTAAAVLARRQIGGYTGDVLGAFQQIGEIVMLLAAAVR